MKTKTTDRERIQRRRETHHKYYNVFHREWWTANPAWPGGREPGAGPRTYIEKHVTYEHARELCAEWNAAHDPGPLSRKAEFEEA